MQYRLLSFFSQISASDVKLPRAGFTATLQSVLRISMVAAALISIIFVVVGGLKYTLSSGDPQGLASAKNTILSALVGLVLAVSAFAIIGFVGAKI